VRVIVISLVSTAGRRCPGAGAGLVGFCGAIGEFAEEKRAERRGGETGENLSPHIVASTNYTITNEQMFIESDQG
jgi:hypothetical protein